MNAKNLEIAQGFAVFAGILLGVIPLVGVLIGQGPMLWNLVLPDEHGASHYVAPIAVLVIAVITVFALEVAKNRR
ncbi:hypothetical protein [Brevibacterium aurantiacum]|uniref:hypothetical protein n=1 Tax=Brevibacterium aurantiacum TaxID=273384 RepID=UPI001642E0B4|nr:hypothetical protein [Brevibacterium aurantiacum]